MLVGVACPTDNAWHVQGTHGHRLCVSPADGHLGGGGNLQASGPRPRAFDPAVVRTSREAHDVFADPEVELVSICTPTDTHVALATAALRAGKHVLLEKPVALAADAIDVLAGEADFVIMDTSPVVSLVNSGQLRGIATLRKGHGTPLAVVTDRPRRRPLC